MVILIVAVSNNNVIGKDNKLLWHLPNDFKRFKQLTSDNYILMGRKTFDSLPGVLPNRTHLIITRQEDYQTQPNCYSFNSIEDAIKSVPNDKDIYVIGGGDIYKQCMNIVDKIEITKVFTDIDGDTFFPEISSEWKLVSEEKHLSDERHKYDYSFQTYIK